MLVVQCAGSVSNLFVAVKQMHVVHCNGSCVLTAMVKGEKGPDTGFTDISITYSIDVNTTYRVSN